MNSWSALLYDYFLIISWLFLDYFLIIYLYYIHPIFIVISHSLLVVAVSWQRVSPRTNWVNIDSHWSNYPSIHPFDSYIARSLMHKSFIYRRTPEKTPMVTRIGNMKTILVGKVRFSTENLSIAKEIVFVAELGLFRSKREKWLREKVGCNIDGISTGTPLILVGNLRTLSSQIKRTDRGFRCIFQRGGNTWFLCMTEGKYNSQEHSRLTIHK